MSILGGKGMVTNLVPPEKSTINMKNRTDMIKLISMTDMTNTGGDVL